MEKPKYTWKYGGMYDGKEITNESQLLDIALEMLDNDEFTVESRQAIYDIREALAYDKKKFTLKLDETKSTSSDTQYYAYYSDALEHWEFTWQPSINRAVFHDAFVYGWQLRDAPNWVKALTPVEVIEDEN